jgi:NAD(P)-dependent dehydrogenase (short-subunit alcohol dehydrogenase family)
VIPDRIPQRTREASVDEFAGIRAVVTGGSSGIGLATAELLRDRGADVGIIDRLVSERGSGFAHVAADITDDEAVAAAVEQLAARLGGIDVLVNNAGIGAQGGIEANDIAEWQRCFDVNVFGMVRVTKAALPHLRRSAHAAVVNTASLVATTGFPSRVLYSATKGAVWSLTLAMAADLCREHIRVNAVAPGTADTPWIARLLDGAADPVAERAALEARQPIGRLVAAEEVASTIAYLASPRQASTTGTVLPVDGGAHSLRPR